MGMFWNLNGSFAMRSSERLRHHRSDMANCIDISTPPISINSITIISIAAGSVVPRTL